MSGISNYILNQKINAILGKSGSGSASDLDAVLTAGNSAGANDIDMNNNDILQLKNINNFLYFDAVNNRLGVNVAVPTEDLEVDGNIQIDTAGLGRLVFYDGQAGHEHAEVDADDDGVNGGKFLIKTKQDGGSVVQRFTIDNVGLCGVNVDTPLRRFHIKDDGSTPSSRIALESTDISSLGAGNQGISWRNTTSNGVGIVDTDFVETGFVGYSVITNDNATFTNELKLWNMVNGVFSPKLTIDATGQVDIADSIKVSNDASSLGGVSGSISGATLTIDGGNVSYGYTRLSVPATSTITTLSATNIRQSGQVVVLIEGSGSGTLTLQGSDAGGITNAKVNFTANIEIPNNTNALLTFFNGNGNIFLSAGKYL